MTPSPDPVALIEHLFVISTDVEAARQPSAAAIGPVVRDREVDEPDWLCDRGYLDEFGRTWPCERVKHEPRQRHQSSVFIAADGSPGTVGWQLRLEWAEP